MRRPSLRSQLNQIRLWVRQGRTDAWIAHKVDISVEELQQFKRDHQLDGERPPSLAPLTAGDPAPQLDELEEEPVEEVDEPDEEDELSDEEEEEVEAEEREEPVSRRRRGRRGGRRRRSRRETSYEETSYEGTFEQGEEGYGLWLDPAISDSDVYSEHWEGHREVTVTVEPDAITIRRA